MQAPKPLEKAKGWCCSFKLRHSCRLGCDRLSTLCKPGIS